jgi:hypothetical protein
MAKQKPLSLAEAKAQAAHWDAMWQQQSYDEALSARFRDATASEVVAMWERGTNEKGQPFTEFEFHAESFPIPYQLRRSRNQHLCP